MRSTAFLALTGLALLPVSSTAQQVKPGPAPEFATEVSPFLDRHCVRCHGQEKQKGDLRIDTLERDFSKSTVASRWMDIMERINSGEMPPKKEPRPKPAEGARVSEWISAQLIEAEAARESSATGSVSFHRLTRDEYRRGIQDLLGVTFDATDPTGLPEDPDWQGIERIGSVLTLSPAHVEKYLTAAETVRAEALALGPEPKRDVVRWTAGAIRVNGDLARKLANQGILDKVRCDIVPDNCLQGHPGESSELKVPVAGEFRVRVKLSGLRPEGGRAPRLMIIGVDFDRVLFEQDIEAPEDQPVIVEFSTHLPAGVHRIRIVNAVPGPNPEGRYSRPLGSKPFFNMKERQPWQLKLTDDDWKPIRPTLIVDWVEWEGPILASWPPEGHRSIFFGNPQALRDPAYAREILSRFATRAYRRPVADPELDRLTRLFSRSREQGESFEAAVKRGLLAILCSKDFLYLIDGPPAAPEPHWADRELASRLSYFLWSTPPDARLLDLARSGTLHEPAALGAEVRRMIADPRSLAFADTFPRQWLQLRRVGMFAPDRKLYPDYDSYLEQSMVTETVRFFREVFRKNLGLREFLVSDWTMLNERLAGHYGIAGIRGEAFQRVALRPEDHRGGLLTQASILSLTSDGTRHRPVHRGKWILESMLGKPPPPPPANAGDLKPAPPTQPKTTLRAKLEAHREDPACAGCHRKIDPLGLAFDNYDAIGRWRTEEAVREGTGQNPKLDPSGELPDGRVFTDAAGLQSLLAEDVEVFAAAFTEKLAAYALRRRISFAERTSLKSVVETAKADGYRLDTLIEAFVLSPLFASPKEPRR
jgi:mono/diheme cytochrome c family protein